MRLQILYSLIYLRVLFVLLCCYAVLPISCYITTHKMTTLTVFTKLTRPGMKTSPFTYRGCSADATFMTLLLDIMQDYDAAMHEDTTVDFAATSTRNFLVWLPFFFLLVLFLCCLLAANVHKRHKGRCKSLTSAHNVSYLYCKYVRILLYQCASYIYYHP